MSSRVGVAIARAVAAFAAVLGLALAGAFGLFLTLSGSLPPASGRLALAGLHAPVTVVRDAEGVPHVEAADRHDLFVAEGYLMAADRLFQMDLLRAAAEGRLAEIGGRRLLVTDRFLRALDLEGLARRSAAQATPEVRAALTAFAQGVNDYLATTPTLPPEHRLLLRRPRPWTWRDSLLVERLITFALSENLPAEVTRGLLAPAPRAVRDRLFPGLPPWPRTTFRPNLSGAEDGIALLGSNAFAVGGPEGGGAFLASDPHLPALLPTLWWLVDLQAPGLHAAGAALPGGPALLIGHNRHLAWGITVHPADTTDLVRPSGARRCRWEVFRVRGGGGERHRYCSAGGLPVVGPWLAGAPRDAALDWVGYRVPPGDGAFLRLLTADLDGAKAALLSVGSPALNVLLADDRGRTLHVRTGLLLDRPAALGLVPFTRSGPARLRPSVSPVRETPVLVSANDPAAPDPAAGFDFAPVWRRERIAALLRHGPPSLPRLLRVQLDDVSELARTVRPRLVAASAALGRGTLARDLARWNGALDAGSRAAAEYELWQREAVRDLVARIPGADARARLARRRYARLSAWHGQALLAAAGGGLSDADLRSELVRVDRAIRRLGGYRHLTWGRLHRVRPAHPLGGLPVVGALFRLPAYPLRGDAYTVSQGAYGERTFTAGIVPSLRVAVRAGDWDRGRVVLLTGESGQPFSAHFADQYGAWLAGRTFPWRYGRPAGGQRLTLLPGPAR